ncbi:MAG: hypothetical protein ABIK28_23715 [Planctomycetota bacterium]
MKPDNLETAPIIASKETREPSSFRSRFLLKLLSSPWTLGPLLAGITTLMVVWTFNIRSGLAIFAGLLGVLGAIGVFFTRLFLGSATLGKETLETMKQEAQAQREEKLDALDEQLSADGDVRTEKCLRDLRALARAFHQEEVWPERMNARSIFDVLQGVEQLFNRSVQLFEKTLVLWRIASNMTTEEARRPILEQRERIIEDIRESIKELGRILAEIQTLGTGGGSEDTLLSHIRVELDQSLEVAKRVETRMNSLDREMDPGV